FQAGAGARVADRARRRPGPGALPGAGRRSLADLLPAPARQVRGEPVPARSLAPPRPGVYWTPNGNHRRTVLDKLKADFVPAIVVVEPEMLFEVLPLNVEKAHNHKETPLAVLRMHSA